VKEGGREVVEGKGRRNESRNQEQQTLLPVERKEGVKKVV